MKYSFIATISCLMFAANAQAAAPTPKGSIGTFHNGTWYLDADRSLGWSGTGPGADEIHYMGTTGDKPFVLYGTACFTNQTAGIGVTRSSTWYVTTNNLDWDNTADPALTFSLSGGPPSTFIPATWNTAPVAFANGYFYIDWNINHRWDSADLVIQFGSPNQIPVIGVWGTSTNGERIGTYDQSTNTFYVDLNGTNAWDSGDAGWHFGFTSSDYPVVIPFSDGVDHIGVFNSGNWYIDTNGNHQWDGVNGGDSQWQFGNPGDIPVVTHEQTWTGACPIDDPGQGLHPV
jgi:hypothetical protein